MCNYYRADVETPDESYIRLIKSDNELVGDKVEGIIEKNVFLK